jgi:hypothetical protein
MPLKARPLISQHWPKQHRRPTTTDPAPAICRRWKSVCNREARWEFKATRRRRLERCCTGSTLYFIFEITVCLMLGPFPSMSRNVLFLLLALCDQLGSFWRRVEEAQGAVLLRGKHCTSTFQARRLCGTEVVYIGRVARYEKYAGSRLPFARS